MATAPTYCTHRQLKNLVLLDVNRLEQDIDVQQQKIKQQQDIGLAKCGRLWQEKKEKAQ